VLRRERQKNRGEIDMMINEEKIRMTPRLSEGVRF
jgi:hypothetical protein